MCTLAWLPEAQASHRVVLPRSQASRATAAHWCRGSLRAGTLGSLSCDAIPPTSIAAGEPDVELRQAKLFGHSYHGLAHFYRSPFQYSRTYTM